MRDYVLAASSVVAVFVTALFGLFANRQKFREDLQAKYDATLHKQRTDVYLPLWRSLEVIAKFAPAQPVTTKHLDDLSVTMREWFFRTGGLYLSDDSREAYLLLQHALAERLWDQTPSDMALDAQSLERIHQKATQLRARLAEDIGSRKSVWF